MKYTLFLTTLLVQISNAHADATTDKCLQAWGKTPFAKDAAIYKTIQASVKVLGVGQAPSDFESTKEPVLILVNPGVNVMGGTTYELMNPNGWYCFKSNVNVMGKLKIKAHCRSHLASATEGVTVMGNDQTSKSVTVMGKTQVEFVNCEQK